MQETAAGAYPSYMEPEPEQTGASATVGVMGCRSPTCPPWLQAAIAGRSRAVLGNFHDDDAHSFMHTTRLPVKIYGRHMFVHCAAISFALRF